jgi:hypothetical protein
MTHSPGLFLLGLASNHDLPISASQIARITSLAPFLVLILISSLFANILYCDLSVVLYSFKHLKINKINHF